MVKRATENVKETEASAEHVKLVAALERALRRSENCGTISTRTKVRWISTEERQLGMEYCQCESVASANPNFQLELATLEVATISHFHIQQERNYP